MKTKILACLAALLLLFPVMFSLNGCAQTDSGSPGESFPLSVKDSAPLVAHCVNTTYYLDENHTLYGWGQNLNYLLQQPIPEVYYADRPLPLLDGVCDVVLLPDVAFALKTDGTLWGVGRIPDLEAGTFYHSEWFLMMEDVVDIDSRSNLDYSCRTIALCKNGSLLLLAWRSMSEAGYGTEADETDGNIAASKCYTEPLLLDTGVTALNGPMTWFAYDTQLESEEDDFSKSITYYTYFKGSTMKASYFFERSADYLAALVEADSENREELLVIRTLEQASGGQSSPWYYRDDTGKLWVQKQEVLADEGGSSTRVEQLAQPKLIAEGVKEFHIHGRALLWLTETGELWGCYGNEHGEFGTDAGYTSDPVLIDTEVAQLCRPSYFYYIKTDRSLWCSGYNLYILGTGALCSEMTSLSEITYQEQQLCNYCPGPVKILDDVEYVVLDNAPIPWKKIAKTTDGRVWIWGYDLLCLISESNTNEPENMVLRIYRTEAWSRMTVDERRETLRHDSLFVPTEWSEAWQSLAVD